MASSSRVGKSSGMVGAVLEVIFASFGPAVEVPAGLDLGLPSAEGLPCFATEPTSSAAVTLRRSATTSPRGRLGRRPALR